jgi:chemotaxis signal transduction protein
MAASPSERRALLFAAGGVRLALRLPMVREIVPVAPDASEVETRGQILPAVPLALALGLDVPPGRLAVLIEAIPPVALRVDEVHGIVDLSRAEVFQLPARTLLPQPPPFQGAVVLEGKLWLELALTSAGWVPLAPAAAEWPEPPEHDLAQGRELVFERAGRLYGVPLSLLVRVLEAPAVSPVPLAPAAHRGLLYHERAIHPVFDIPVLYGGPPAPGASLALLVDAGGTAVAILGDRMAAAGDDGGRAGEVVRPAWDALFPA